MWHKTRVVSSIAVITFVTAYCSGWARAQTRPSDEELQDKIEALQQKDASLQEQVDQLRNQMQSPATRPAETNAAPEKGWQVGYADGVVVKDDPIFKITVNGLLDARYTFVNAANRTSLTNTALGTSRVGDMSGFSLNTAQIAISGSIYQHGIFKFMGNFGSSASYTTPTSGTFQVAEAWGGYSVSPDLNFRVGSMVIPFIPLKTIANYGGQEFPDISDVSVPFSVGYSLGADVYGITMQHHLSYDLMVGNGSNANNAVDSAVNAAGRDNRFSVYTREQFAGSGQISDFFDDPDVQDHDCLAWIVGAGAGFESQNSSASAFPGPQTSEQIGALSAATAPGYIPAKYILNGDLYRGAADFRTKYQGWSTFTEIYFQNIASEAGPIIPGYDRSHVSQAAYFVQSGYFLVPKHLEIAGRFGEVYTLNLPHHMDEYSLGLNYYAFGENMKVQLAETYIPQTAGLTSGNGSLVNTQDWITEFQVQVKF